MSMIKSHIKALIGPRLSSRVSNLLYGPKTDEVAFVYEAYDRLGIVGTMLDVGAHHGNSLHNFANAGWKVYAFEPNPKNRRHLEVLASNFAGVTIDPRGVSDTVRSAVPFFISDKIGSISSLSRFHATHESTQVIDIVSLSEFARERDLGHVEFIKIDVEGHDLFVLKGIDWERMSPDCIVCEFEDRKTVSNGYTTEDLFDYLVDHSYQVVISEWYPIAEYGVAHRWKAFRRRPNEIDTQSWGNIIACRTSSPIASLLSWEALHQRSDRGI